MTIIGPAWVIYGAGVIILAVICIGGQLLADWWTKRKDEK